MRLLNCYIENFGGLSGYSVNFRKDLTIIMEENGFGKTTLAAFIKAMFYGFPKGTKSLEKNERKLYTPWQGGKFGGNLSFEYNGLSYRIERSFGSTPKQDTFVLYKLDPFEESDAFSERIGFELFQLDVESYEKSTYMAQNQDGVLFATAGIEAKLGDLVEESDDIYNFDKAMSLLKDERIKYKLYRGHGGSISELKNRISQLQSEIAQKEIVLQQQEALKKQCEDLISNSKVIENEIKEIRKRITNASEAAVINNSQSHLLEMKEEQSVIEKEIEVILSQYPNGLPSSESVREALNAADELSKLEIVKGALTLNPQDIKIVEENKARFADSCPDEEELSYFKDLSNEYMSEKTRQDVIRENTKDDSSKKVSIGFYIAGILILIAGVAFVITSQYIPGVIGVAAGAILFIVALMMGKKSTNKNDSIKLQSTERLNYLSETITKFMGKYFDGNIEPDQFNNLISSLEMDVAYYKNAKILVDKYNEEYEKLSASAESYKNKLKSFETSYGPFSDLLTSEKLRIIKDHIVRVNQLKSDAEKKEQQIQLFIANNPKILNVVVKDNPEDLNKLKKQEEKLLSESDYINSLLSDVRQKIEYKRARSERFPELEDELELVCERYEQEKKDCEILDETMLFLQEAKDKITNSQINPVKDRFTYYVNQILGENNFNVFMNKDLEIKPEKLGEARELTYFSAGYTDIVRVCMHFALVDVLFKDGDCFVILDDPFVNLDDKNTKEAVRLLKELSKSKQIIYLVCNSSRV